MLTVAASLPALAAAQELSGVSGGSWVGTVHYKVGRSTNRISRQLRDGVYIVRFVIGPGGAASGFAIRGSRPEAAQYALLTGALALTAFPPPPDGLAHAIEVPIRVHNGRRHPRR